MNQLTICVLTAALLTIGLPSLGAAEMSATTLHPVTVTQLKQLVLDGGGHAFIGSDHKMYLVVNGKTTPAPAGHYSLANGGCVTVAANAAVDPASLQRLMMSTER